MEIWVTVKRLNTHHDSILIVGRRAVTHIMEYLIPYFRIFIIDHFEQALIELRYIPFDSAWAHLLCSLQSHKSIRAFGKLNNLKHVLSVFDCHQVITFHCLGIDNLSIDLIFLLFVIRVFALFKLIRSIIALDLILTLIKLLILVNRFLFSQLGLLFQCPLYLTSLLGFGLFWHY